MNGAIPTSQVLEFYSFEMQSDKQPLPGNPKYILAPRLLGRYGLCMLSRYITLFLSISLMAGVVHVSAEITDQGSQPNKHQPAFAVASVKENKSKGPRSDSNIPLDLRDGYVPNGGTFHATNQPLLKFVVFAYKVNTNEMFNGLLQNVPRWALEDSFDIDARADMPNPTNDDMRLMVQSLLEDRFKLKVHRSIKERPVLALYLAKAGHPGPQLIPHDQNSSCTSALPFPTPGTPLIQRLSKWPPQCGARDENRSTAYAVRFGGRDMPMSAIADSLAIPELGPFPVVNRTGLTGRYDFIMEFVPERNRQAFESDSTENRKDAPTYQEAVRDQLGLQLKKETGSASFFSIDHIEYPTPN